MIEARFERMFEFIGGLGIFTFALRVDGLPKVQNHLGLFALLHG